MRVFLQRFKKLVGSNGPSNILHIDAFIIIPSKHLHVQRPAIEILKDVQDMFKINNKDTRRTSTLNKFYTIF